VDLAEQNYFRIGQSTFYQSQALTGIQIFKEQWFA